MAFYLHFKEVISVMQQVCYLLWKSYEWSTHCGWHFLGIQHHNQSYHWQCIFHQ